MPAAMRVRLRGILAPSRLEISEGFLGLDIIRGLITPLQVLGDVLAILPAAEVQRVAHQMHDTGLHCGVGESRVDSVREALEAVQCSAVVCLQTRRGDNGDQNVLNDEPCCAIGPSDNGECCADCSSPRARTWPLRCWRSTAPEPRVRPPE
jgi:hypothetical protein